MLNDLLTPLLQRIFSSLSDPVTGTDDEVQVAELRRDFLNFIVFILNNDLGQVLISEGWSIPRRYMKSTLLIIVSANKDQFETILNVIEHYAKEISDVATAKLAVNLLSKMSFVFGPAIGNNKIAATLAGVIPPQEQPLPGFENLMTERFSLLCWEIPYSSGFNSKDAQGRAVLGEIASLQKMLYLKLGEGFLDSLKGVIFPRIGVNRGIEEYCDSLRRSDAKQFKAFFLVNSPLRTRCNEWL